MFQKLLVRLQRTVFARTLGAANPVFGVAPHDKIPTCLTVAQMQITNKHFPSGNSVTNGESDFENRGFTNGYAAEYISI